MIDLKEKSFELMKHLNSEEIIEIDELDILKDQTFEDDVLLLRKNSRKLIQKQN